MRSDKIEAIRNLPCNLFVKALHKEKKLLLIEIHKIIDSDSICFISERNNRGHYLYKIEKEKVEVLPVEVLKFPNSKFHNRIRTIKLSSFLENRLSLGLTITTERLYSHYKKLLYE